ETRVAGIPGAAGCFHAVRAPIHLRVLPEDISRDFAAALLAREHGLRAVSVESAVCTVPRVPSLRKEYRRKVRTIVRGWHTLRFKRALLKRDRKSTRLNSSHRTNSYAACCLKKKRTRQ